MCKIITYKAWFSILLFQVYVSSPYIKNLDVWKQYGVRVSTDNSKVAANTDIIFLAVKPHILPEAVDKLRQSENFDKIKNKLFVSILAGFTIKMLEELLNKFPGCRVIRVMPNLPMMIGEGCTAYCPGKNVSAEDVSVVKKILEVSGVCEMIPENHMNAVTALSGAGPAFVYLMIEALSDGAVKMGLHRDMATKFAVQTVLGAAKMVKMTGKHTGELKDEVCSAGGSTIAGIHALEKAGVRGGIMNALEASATRASELGKTE
ncbi:pyrroline-5-carboxylate reductase [Holotrichia oblita]|uniref:Pyrroline-5-carboxylate reductase n=1 Tax=Holotrichia oblita TaxID=644536 RepID=A0ACB9SUE7_HOLOL|nr:pyrroline-5-carboxylate reductase [Holotrichia oblita]